MKPIYVKMSAFGSYAGVEVVDFNDVNHGIFLITGDTGAGKTTIFDAITYALYDETSGGKRDGEMMRSQYSEEETRTFVELKFIYNEEIYTIIRYPKQNRISRKKNKDGEYTMMVDQPNVELILPDGLPFKGKIRETNQKIVDIVGLDVNQFTQIAMIAQGDFLKLLHAPSKERKEIFTKIFNTKIYWRIEEELKLRAKALNSRLEDNRKDIEREMDNVHLIEESNFTTQWIQMPHFLESDSEKLIDLVKQIIEEAKEKEEVISNELKYNQEELDKVLAGIQLAKDINKLFDTLEDIQKKKEKLDNGREEMKVVKLRIDTAKKAALVEPKESVFLMKEKDLEECSNRITQIKTWLDNNKEQLENFKLLKEESELEYKKKTPELSTKISKINDLLPKYELLEEKASVKEELETKKKKAQLELNLVLDSISLEREQQDKVSSEQENLKKISDQSALLVQAVEKLTEKKKEIETLLSSMKRMQAYGITSENTQKEYEKAVKDCEEKTHIYEVIYQRFIEGQAGILAATLTEGSPCPVCGSISHPQIAMLTNSETNIGQKELQEAKNAMETARKSELNKYHIFQQEKQRYENEKNLTEHEGKKLIDPSFNAETVKEATIQAALNDCNEQLKMDMEKKMLAEKAKKQFETNEKEIQKLSEALKTHTEEKEWVEKNLKELEINLATADSEIKSLKETLLYENKEIAKEELAASKDEIQGLEKKMSQMDKNYQNLFKENTEKQGNRKTEESSLLRFSEETKNAKAEFMNYIMKQGFADVLEYHAAVMKAEKIDELNESYQLYREEVIKNDENLKNYKEQTTGKSKMQTDLMEERKKALETVKLRLDEESKTIYGIRSRDEVIYTKVTKFLDIRKEVKKEYSIISRLDATANGKLSQCHMNFQTFIQRKYFNSILKEANKRLYTMSNGQFILQCKDVKELSGQGEVGLDLDVYSMVNDQTRDVKTLSGGESFMASLAMALGMADIIQNTAGSIHIDTMFIDEGFGSLSDETRMQAINILNELSEGKRLVGIISHVTELKAQIGTKLIVTKGEKGSKVKWDIGE